MDSFLTDDLIDLMRKCLRLNSVVTVAFLALCSASGSNAEPDTAIEHAAAPVEPAQGPNMTVVPDRDANVSTAQTENDAAKNLYGIKFKGGIELACGHEDDDAHEKKRRPLHKAPP